ncbi:MAG: hypothetical protein AB7R55_05330 [Gemmatimonadales bacterium]
MSAASGPPAKPDARRWFAHQWGHLLARVGLPRVAGAVFGWLQVCTPAAQGVRRICSALGLPRGPVRSNLELLVGVGLVEQLPGDQPALDRYRLSADGYDGFVRSRLETVRDLLELTEVGFAAVRSRDDLPVDRLLALHRFLNRWESSLAGLTGSSPAPAVDDAEAVTVGRADTASAGPART